MDLGEPDNEKNDSNCVCAKCAFGGCHAHEGGTRGGAVNRKRADGGSYRRALGDGELEGLKRNLAEKRIAEFTPVLATSEIEYKFNYRLEGDNAVLEMRSSTEPCISPDPVGIVRVPSWIDGHKVIGIGNGSFYNCHKMTKIILHDNLEWIWPN